MLVRDFLKRDSVRLSRILAKPKSYLRDAAEVNATRWKLVGVLKETGLAVETASGGRTKFNRRTLGIPKSHALDAFCVGEVKGVEGWRKPTLTITCMGRGSYQRTRLTQYGFPSGYLMRKNRFTSYRQVT